MKKYFVIILALLFFIIGTSCNNNVEPKITSIAKRTVVIYMIATNTLSSNSKDDLNEISATIQNIEMNNCRLLIYKDSYSELPQLLEYKRGTKSLQIISHKTYDNETSSTTIERMKQVFDDVVNIAPANDYGLILWSHASGWAQSLAARSNISPLNFGDDNGKEMSISDLTEALPSGMFSFVYSDACYMSCIEVVYELRNKIKYFVGSVTELPADGMDYTNNLPCFFEDNANLIQACRNTFNKYNRLNGQSRTCTISLIDCSKLDVLASICKNIHQLGVSTTPTHQLQRYKYTSPYLFYDFAQYTKSINATNSSNNSQIASLKEDFEAIMPQVVVYKATTPTIFSQFTIDANVYSGLSTYILGTTSTSGINESYYKTLSWYKDVIKQ